MDNNIIYLQEPETIINCIINRFPKAQKFCIVTDENIKDIHLQTLVAQFPKQITPQVFILKSGEENKKLKNAKLLLNVLFQNNFSRQDVLISLGGGLLSDFVSFSASIYKRGCIYVCIPTTILCMSDACIGSKNGVNNKYGKNMIGTFYDFSFLIICIHFLSTLDLRNISNGFAEIIKMACILDSELFSQLQVYTIEQLIENKPLLLEVIKKSILLKQQVVQEDKYEQGLRKILNYGHTIGHGIEYASKGKLLHGEAVSIGIILANKLSYQFQKQNFDEEIQQVLVKYGLPVTYPKYIDPLEVLKYMRNDKKVQVQSCFDFVFIQEIGNAYKDKTFKVKTEQILNLLQGELQDTFLVQKNEENINQQINLKPHFASKSILNRMLLLSCLQENNSQIILQNASLEAGEDIFIMAECLKTLQMGEIQENKQQREIIIKPNGGRMNFTGKKQIYVGNSGTTARFLTAVMLLLKENQQQVVFECDQRMKERPMRGLFEVLERFLHFQYLEKPYCFPFMVYKEKPLDHQLLKEMKLQLEIKETNISSQYLSGLLMVIPCAFKEFNEVEIKTTEKQEISESFIQMTIKSMQKFGIQIILKENSYLFVKQQYQIQNNQIFVESDACTTSYDVQWALLNKKDLLLENVFLENSIQGDFNFIEALKQIGFVFQTTQQGILIKGSEDFLQKEQQEEITLDFSNCGDTFITFCCLAPFCFEKKVFNLIGIENQKVKESNRIKAVIKNLKQFNIFACEIQGGIQVFSNKKNLINKKRYTFDQQVFIKSYNDHRIAMAFTILANFLSNLYQKNFVIINNKNCVNKTFNQFYFHIENYYGIKISQINYQRPKNQIQKQTLLIGMRFSGKSTLSNGYVQKKGIQFIDLDKETLTKYYPQIEWTQMNYRLKIKDEIGIENYRDKESKCLKELIKKILTKNNDKNIIFALGGGIVCRQENRDILKYFKKQIIYLNKIFNYTVEPQFILQDETFWKDIQQRKDLYNQLNRKTLTIQAEYRHNINEQKLFNKTLKNTLNVHPFTSFGNNTFFLCLFYEDLILLNNQQKLYIVQNYTYVEIRADRYFEQKGDIDEFIANISSLKYYAENPLQFYLIFTIRTQQEGGYFTKENHDYFNLIKQINKFSIFDFFDIEINQIMYSNFNLEKLDKNIIFSTHFYSLESQRNNLKKYLQFVNNKYPQSVKKMILAPQTTLNEFYQINSQITPPYICFVQGQNGIFTRVFNDNLTPVFDKQLGEPTGSGQMEKKEILQLKKSLFLHRNKFYIFGSSIKLSPTPYLYEKLFQRYNLQDYTIERAEIQSIEEIEKYIKAQDFNGGVVTMPFKQEINKYVDYVWGKAKKIDQERPVINTIVKSNNGKITGFNTDYDGVYRLLKNFKISQKDKNTYVLVVGAGGTSRTVLYCLKKLNLKVVLYSRNENNISNELYAYKSTSFDEISSFLQNNNGVFELIVSSIPGNSEMTIPQEFIQKNCWIFDVSYIPKETWLVKQAKQVGCEKIIYGIDLICTQAILQSQILLGRKTDKNFIRNNVLQFYQGINQK